MVTEQETVQRKRKKRSQAEKVGRLKYILQQVKATRKDIEEIKRMQRTIIAGLKDFFDFKKPLIEKICCKDEVDALILQVLFEAGRGGVYPKDVAARLKAYKVTRHHVSRRLKRMNKRLAKELGQKIAEKQGHRWALTSFGYDIWGETEEAEYKEWKEAD